MVTRVNDSAYAVYKYMVVQFEVELTLFSVYFGECYALLSALTHIV